MSDENIFLFYTIYTGVYITFLYDIIRVFRRVFTHGKFMVSLEDMAFWVYCGVKVFMLMYRFSDGMLRWFGVLGALTGMCFYKRFISTFFVSYTTLILVKIKKAVLKTAMFFLRPLVKFLIKAKKKLTLLLKFLKMAL